MPIGQYRELPDENTVGEPFKAVVIDLDALQIIGEMMRKDLDDLLCQRYPLIFAERRRSIKESCMGWGVACGDGWFDLIDTLCERLQFWTDHNHAPQVVAAQVKEKFGELCFYPRTTPSPEQKGMIIFSGAMSVRICDQCGKPGQTLVHNFWYVTRCSRHAPEGAVPKDVFVAERERTRPLYTAAELMAEMPTGLPMADGWDTMPMVGKELDQCDKDAPPTGKETL